MRLGSWLAVGWPDWLAAFVEGLVGCCLVGRLASQPNNRLDGWFFVLVSVADCSVGLASSMVSFGDRVS